MSSPKTPKPNEQNKIGLAYELPSTLYTGYIDQKNTLAPETIRG